ncbi:Tyrosine-protein kinase HTK16-like [Homarus americanus]|uniref:Tyrosine-protein kinase n=1 Tax=Homarus americanus TaxID=6706 RepID=A0A8J5K7L7_HOMAM|nr:Tyrosine-protein kinase HTK16-like [Homarus americanus]
MASSASRSEVDEERCYFGKITSDEAKEILLKDGGEEGTFLIRKSCSSRGNYVLSFITEGHPIHILIQKYKEDAFFSLVVADEAPVFHGLDTLITHYCSNPVGASSTILSHPCVGKQLPAEVRLHGSSSLLHRSTSQGNINIVLELLKCGYKKIDEKNNNGQTALHIASMKGYEEIAKMLLTSMAYVEVRDEEGVTPLHLASRYNRPGIVRLLVEKSKADIQSRATNTDAVPLHEAAEHGNTECVKTLLSLGAPSCPRNSRMEIPLDLAKKMGHKECYQILVHHRPPACCYTLKDYYHGRIDRHLAQERLLGSPDANSGHFLLRQSTRKQDKYVLTLLFQNQLYNYEVSGKGEMFYIDDGPYFVSLETMVDHYIRFMDGMPSHLIKPVPPPHPLSEEITKNITARHPHVNPNLHEMLACEDSDGNPSSSEQQPLLSASSQEDLKAHPSYTLEVPSAQNPNIVITKSESRLSQDLIDLQEPERMYERSSSRCSNCQPKVPSRESLKLDLKSLTITNNPDTAYVCGSSPTMDGNRTDEIFGEIDIKRLTVGQCLGNGEFGSVLKGIWLSPSGDKMTFLVAMKKMSVNIKLTHKPTKLIYSTVYFFNIQIDVAVKTLHNDDKVNKKNFLKEAEVMMNLNHLYIVKLVGVCHGPPVAMVQELMAMGSLLDFLLEHEKDISVDFHLKLWAAQIAEGMMYLEQKHFVHRDLAARNILLSSVTLAKISDFGLSRALGVDKDYYTASDGGKWPLKCYGITLWEMYTFGNQPYGELPGHKVVEMLESKERLPKPEKCPKGVFDLMLRCWNYKASKRPAFGELAAIFRTKPEYINIKPYFK